MNLEMIQTILALIFIFLIGVVMFVAARWSRKKREEFQKTVPASLYKNPLEGKPILEQIKSEETWARVVDGLRIHDPFSEKNKAMRHDFLGYYGKVPLTIITLITFGLIALVALVFISI
ncbi:MAG: hypothetical protein HUN04_20960 [Desulfobacter sp.]|nr:MAG: hypothetical protein HUN04_20960 [Desulfobacter sp.]